MSGYNDGYPSILAKGPSILAGRAALGLPWRRHHPVGIEKGKDADLVLINRNSPNLGPPNDPISAVMLGANVSKIDALLVEVKAVKQGGRLPNDWSSAKK